MRLANRMRKLQAAVPPCDGRIRRLVVAGRESVDEPPCPRCGESHLLVIEEVIVTATPDADDPGASIGRGGG